MNMTGYHIASSQDPNYHKQECECPDCYEGYYHHYDATSGNWLYRRCATCEGTGIVIMDNYGELVR